VELSTRLRRLWLRILTVVAMYGPTMGMRVRANRWRGVQIGDRPWLGALAYLDIHHSHPERRDSLVMGDNVAIGNNVSIYTHDSLYNRITDGREPVVFCKVRIGSHVNVSPGSFLYNCTIGDHSIVAPHAVVVNGEFPAFSLIAGNPAKRVKDLRDVVEGS
jgi:carbonic anhydrase/acetyltransferase-like protein (isoleucine patch superfamily)